MISRTCLRWRTAQYAPSGLLVQCFVCSYRDPIVEAVDTLYSVALIHSDVCLVSPASFSSSVFGIEFLRVFQWYGSVQSSRFFVLIFNILSHACLPYSTWNILWLCIIKGGGEAQDPFLPKAIPTFYLGMDVGLLSHCPALAYQRKIYLHTLNMVCANLCFLLERKPFFSFLDFALFSTLSHKYTLF